MISYHIIIYVRLWYMYHDTENDGIWGLINNPYLYIISITRNHCNEEKTKVILKAPDLLKTWH